MPRHRHFLLLLLSSFVAYGADAQKDTGGYPLSPFRIEVGGYGNAVNNNFGTWNGGLARVWYRSRIFTPMFSVDRQTRPQGTQTNYSVFSYLNWSQSFYTTQGYSWSSKAGPATTYFPHRRYDVRGYWKIPPRHTILLSAGYSGYDLGASGHGQIFSAGVLTYHKKWVVDSNLFINRSQPGNLYSASGQVGVQYGQEGHSWIGVTVGGGRELYQLIGQTPIEAKFSSYSVGTSYRKWLTKHLGVVFIGDYVDKLGAYRRVGGSANLFFEF